MSLHAILTKHSSILMPVCLVAMARHHVCSLNVMSSWIMSIQIGSPNERIRHPHKILRSIGLQSYLQITPAPPTTVTIFSEIVNFPNIAGIKPNSVTNSNKTYASSDGTNVPCYNVNDTATFLNNSNVPSNYANIAYRLSDIPPNNTFFFRMISSNSYIPFE
jgi:hypothetical protein